MTIQPNSSVNNPALTGPSFPSPRHSHGSPSDSEIDAAKSWIATSLSDTDADAEIDSTQAAQISQNLIQSMRSDPARALQSHSALDPQTAAALVQNI